MPEKSEYQRNLEVQGLLLYTIGVGAGVDEAVGSITRSEQGRLNGPRNRLRIARKISQENVAALVSLGFIFPLNGKFEAAKLNKARMVMDRFPQDEVDPLADDPVLMTVDAPPGWKFVPTGDNGYWSNLVDPDGRVRGTQFYKGAFYDRNASFDLVKRYHIDSEYNEETCNLAWDKREGLPYVRYNVKDRATGQKLWEGEWLTVADSRRLDEYTDDYKGLKYQAERDQKFGFAWLREHYPVHDKIEAYW